MATLIIAQVLLTLTIGLWIGSKFSDVPVIQFFGRNDWFVGTFLMLVGYMNFVTYPQQYIQNLNIFLMVFGGIMSLFSLVDIIGGK